MSLNRNLRLGVSLLLLAGVATILAPYVTSYVSTSAVVNSPLVTIRAPFDGRVAAPSPGVAMQVQAHDRLGLILGERQDRSALADLIAQDGAARGMARAVGREAATLAEIDADLNRREAAFRNQVLAANGALQREIAASLRANQARVREAALRVRRSRTLAAGGALPTATLDSELAELDVNRAETGRLAALLDDARIEREGILAGVVPRKSGTANDYQRQRRDEIAMRLATLGTDAARLATEREGLAARIAVAQAREEAHRQFAVAAATNGVVWRASPPEGTELLAGDEFLKLVDCDRRFVEVTVPERHFEVIAPGTQAIVRLMGSETAFAARVDAVKGSGAKPDHPDLAAEPPEVPPGQLRVIVRLDPPADPAAAAAAFCDVGRTAEVRFERSLGGDLRGLRRLRTNMEELIADLWRRAPVVAALE